MQHGEEFLGPDHIFEVASGFMAAKHLFVANGVGLFDALANGPKTLPELDAEIALSPRILTIVADAMVATGLLEREGDRYRNGRDAAMFLTEDSPAGMKEFVTFW